MLSTKKEIEYAIEEYRQAMLEAIDLDEAILDLNLKQKKNHKRISMARDGLRALRYN